MILQHKNSAIELFRGGLPQLYLAGTPKAGIKVASESPTAQTVFRAIYSGYHFNQTTVYYFTVDSGRPVAPAEKGYLLQPGRMRSFRLAPEHQFRMEMRLFADSYEFFFRRAGLYCLDISEAARVIKKRLGESPPGRQALFMVGREIPPAEVEALKVQLGDLRYEGPSTVQPNRQKPRSRVYIKQADHSPVGSFFITPSGDLVFPGTGHGEVNIGVFLEGESSTDETDGKGLEDLVAMAERLFSSSNGSTIRIRLPSALEAWEMKIFEETLVSAAARRRHLPSKP